MTAKETDRTALRAFSEHMHARLPETQVDVLLFGSKARGDDRFDSDIDVLVIVPNDDLQTRDAIYGASLDVSLEHDVVISPKVRSREAFERMRNGTTPFARNVIREGVPI